MNDKIGNTNDVRSDGGGGGGEEETGVANWKGAAATSPGDVLAFSSKQFCRRSKITLTYFVVFLFLFFFFSQSNKATIKASDL